MSSELVQKLRKEFFAEKQKNPDMDIDSFCARYPDVEQELRDTIAYVSFMGSPDVVAVSKLELPDNSDRYELDAEIKKGGFGTVSRYWDKSLDRAVAIKVPNDTVGPHQLGQIVSEARMVI